MNAPAQYEPKHIACADPQNEAHQAAMAIAFNTGSSTTVKPDPFLPAYHVLNWEGRTLASFHREIIPTALH